MIHRKFTGTKYEREREDEEREGWLGDMQPFPRRLPAGLTKKLKRNQPGRGVDRLFAPLALQTGSTPANCCLCKTSQA
jgi:hypothetical protein